MPDINEAKLRHEVGEFLIWERLRETVSRYIRRWRVFDEEAIILIFLTSPGIIYVDVLEGRLNSWQL